MKRVAIFTTVPTDATSWYRCFGPMGKLGQVCNFQPVFMEQINWATLSFVDVLYMHLATTSDHAKIIRMAKAIGKKVWLDYDDDLTCVPADNPTHERFQKEQESFSFCVAQADVVSCTTDRLANTLAKWNSNVVVVPNALDEWLVSRCRKEKQGSNKIMFWRGSKTHTRDITEHSKAIIQALDENKDWSAVFMGMNPWMVTEHISPERVKVIAPMDIVSYFDVLSKIQPDIMIVPLHDSPFNRAKSNISWLEGSVVGAAVLRPDWGDWHPELEVAYKDPKDFHHRLTNMMAGNYDLKKIAETNWAYISENLLLGKSNELRRQILETL